jgi:hypothetical protein
VGGGGRERQSARERIGNGAPDRGQLKGGRIRPQISVSGKEHNLALILPLLSRKEVDRCLGIVKAVNVCSYVLFGRARRIFFGYGEQSVL